MAVSKIPSHNTAIGKTDLKPTDKLILVSARDVMATVLDAIAQARRAGMRTATTSRERNGRKVVIIAFAIPEHDVMADGETFRIDGRAITDADAWADLRDVMAETKAEEYKPSNKRVCIGCGWIGAEDDCFDYKHPVGARLCPECYEITEKM